MPDVTAMANKRKEPRILLWIDRISHFAAILAAVAMAALLINVVLDVVLRVVTGRPLGLTLELTTYWWMPVLVALSYAKTEQLQEHIKVTMLLDRLSDRMRRNVEGTFSAIGTALVILLAWYCTVDAINAAEVRQAANSVPLLPYWHMKIFVAGGVILLALQFAASTYRHFAGLTKFEDEILTEADVA